MTTESEEKSLIDVAKHLRFVHFTLVATCLAVLVILSVESPVQINEAYEDIRAIQLLRSNWNTTFLKSAAAEKLAEESVDSARFLAGDQLLEVVETPPNQWPLDENLGSIIVEPKTGERYQISFRSGMWSLIGPNKHPVETHVNTDGIRSLIDINDDRLHLPRYDAPERLGEFTCTMEWLRNADGNISAPKANESNKIPGQQQSKPIMG